MKKSVIFAVVAIIIIGTGFYIRSTRKPSVTYRTVAVEKGTIISSVSATGTLNAVTTVQVGTQVSGTIQRLFVDFNSRVKKGQAIAQIDPSLFEAQVQQTRGSSISAQASVEKARVTVADAKRSLERNRQLFRDGIVAQSDLDAAETKYDEARASLRAAEAQVGQTIGSVRQSETNLRYTTIRSPVDGIIISRNVDVGQTVAASFQTPTLFTIAQDLTKMQIDTSIDEADIGRLAEGQPVSFTVDAYPEMKFKGKVAQIRNAPIVTQNVVTYNVIITVDNQDLKLKPGMTANVTIEVARKDNVLKLPAAALRYKPKKDGDDAEQKGEMKKRRPQGQQVYLLGTDQKPTAVVVKTGIAGEGSLEVIDGKLKENDKVIIGDSSTKKSGSAAGGAMKMGPRF